MEQQAKKSFLINLLYIAAVGGLIFIIGRFLLSRMFPFLLSVIIAYAAQKPAEILSRKTNIKKSVFAVILSAAIYIGTAALLIFLIWRLIMYFAGLIDYLPEIFSQFAGVIKKLELTFSNYMPKEYTFSLTGIAQNLLESLTTFLGDAVKGVIKGTPGFLFSSVVALVAGCYISKDFDGLSKFIKSLCGENVYGKFLRIKNIITHSIFKMLKGYLILMLITFLEVWIGLTVLRVKNAYIYAIFIALVDFLPVFGTGAVMVPWAIISAFYGNIGFSVALAILYIIIVIIRNFTEPKIVSNQIGVNPLFTLVAMFAGLRIFGGVGLVLFPLILIVTIKYYKEEMEKV